MARPHKYEHDDMIEVEVKTAIPDGEFDILWRYAHGMSVNQICIETGCAQETVVDILRRNIMKLLL